MTFGGGAVATIMGGIAAEATGGDFAEGALTAMVVFLYNEIGDYVARAGRRDGLQQTAELRAVQRARSYKEITKARKAIAALYSNGADVAMIATGLGETAQIAKLTLSEAKTLMKLWGKGSFKNRAESIRYHANEHGGGDYVKYLRKAANFNFRRARSTGVRMDGSIKYTRPNGEYIIMRDGLTISYGKNKLW